MGGWGGGGVTLHTVIWPAVPWVCPGLSGEPTHVSKATEVSAQCCTGGVGVGVGVGVIVVPLQGLQKARQDNGPESPIPN